jgi:acyl dehydratase
MTQPSPNPLSLDFDALEVGQQFATAGRTITETDLVSFSALTGDWHPQHTDATWAARSRFSQRIAHGMLLVSYAAGLVPFDPERVVALRSLEEVTFMRAVYIGDTIRLEGTVRALQPLDRELGLVTFRWRVLNERDRTVVRARVRLLWRRAAAQSQNGEVAGWAAGIDGAAATVGVLL